jgi:hypothetical protein
MGQGTKALFFFKRMVKDLRTRRRFEVLMADGIHFVVFDIVQSCSWM